MSAPAVYFAVTVTAAAVVALIAVASEITTPLDAAMFAGVWIVASLSACSAWQKSLGGAR